MQVIDLQANKFGRWLVIARSGSDERGQARFLCRCDCGNEKIIAGKVLRAGKSVSCGCWQKESVSARRKTHGCSNSPEHRAWAAMRNRCSNSKPAYKHWNGRGIRVCKRWGSFENFLEDVGPRPSAKHSIDRINVDGDYNPQNVRWATRKQQARNTTKTVYVSVGGRTESLVDAAEAAGIKPDTVRRRLSVSGFTAEEAVLTPILKNQYSVGRPSKRVRVVKRKYP